MGVVVKADVSLHVNEDGQIVTKVVMTAPGEITASNEHVGTRASALKFAKLILERQGIVPTEKP